MSVIVPSSHTGIGAWVNSKMYNIISCHARVSHKQPRIHRKLGLQLLITQFKRKLLFLTFFSALVANPKKTTLHGGQSRSWFAEQGKKKKKKSLAAPSPPHPPRALLVRRKIKIKNHTAHLHV